MFLRAWWGGASDAPTEGIVTRFAVAQQHAGGRDEFYAAGSRFSPDEVIDHRVKVLGGIQVAIQPVGETDLEGDTRQDNMPEGLPVAGARNLNCGVGHVVEPRELLLPAHCV